MSRLRALAERPIAVRDRHRAFAAVAAVLLTAAVALSIAADPPDRPHHSPTDRLPPLPSADRAAGNEPAEAPGRVLAVARRFLDDYLARIHGTGSAGAIRGASAGLRRRLAAQRVRVSPAARRQRPAVQRLDGHRLGDGWLIRAEVATGQVSYPVALVVADRPAGPVVTRLVED
jgi:hypothetical protein